MSKVLRLMITLFLVVVWGISMEKQALAHNDLEGWSIRIEEQNIALVMGESEQLTVVMSDDLGNETILRVGVKYRSLQPTIVPVSSNGTIFGCQDGQSKIQAVYKGLKAYTIVNVATDASPSMQEIPKTVPFTSTGLGNGSRLLSDGGDKPPIYPKNALTAGKEGDVEIRVLVKADGTVEKIETLKLSGDLSLEKAARYALEHQWKNLFKPYNKNYYIDILFIYRLNTEVRYILENAETRP